MNESHGIPDISPHQDNFDENPGTYSDDLENYQEKKLLQNQVEEQKKIAEEQQKKADEQQKRIDEQQKRIEEAERKSITDHLTGFENRRGLEIHKEELKNSPYPIIFFSVDLDNLKNLNDTYGHKAGDKYILSFVKFSNQFFEPNNLKFRLGGDEFLIIIENTDFDPDLTQKISERITQELESFNKVNKEEATKNQKPFNELQFTFGSHEIHSQEDIDIAIKESDAKLINNKFNKKLIQNSSQP